MRHALHMVTMKTKPLRLSGIADDGTEWLVHLEGPRMEALVASGGHLDIMAGLCTLMASACDRELETIGDYQPTPVPAKDMAWYRTGDASVYDTASPKDL